MGKWTQRLCRLPISSVQMGPSQRAVTPIAYLSHAGSVGHLPAYLGVGAYFREQPKVVISGVPPKIRTNFPHSNALSLLTAPTRLQALTAKRSRNPGLRF